MPKKAPLHLPQTEGKRTGGWELKIKPGQIIFITVLQSLLALGTALPGEAIGQESSESLQQTETTKERPDKSDISEEETRDALYRKLISLAAFEPHKLNAKFLSQIIESRINTEINTEDNAARASQKVNQVAALLLFNIGEYEKFRELISRTPYLREPISSQGKLRNKLIEAGIATIDGNFNQSEMALKEVSVAFFQVNFLNKIERVAHGRIFTELLKIYINPGIGNSLHQKILTDAIDKETLNCEDKNHLKIQLRDTLLLQLSDTDEDDRRVKVLRDLPKINRDCFYNKNFVSIQDAIANALNRLISDSKITDTEEILTDEDGYKMLEASLVTDPQSITIKSIVETNKLYTSTISATNKFLASLILSDKTAEIIFKKSTSPYAHTAINKSIIAREALRMTNSDKLQYSQEDKEKALNFAKFATQNLITASKKFLDNPNIAWEFSDTIIDLMNHLSNNELASLAKTVEDYIVNINQPKIIQDVIQDTIYMAYIASEDFDNAAQYGSKIELPGLKAWKKGSIYIPNSGSNVSPEDIEYIARSGSHLYLVEKIGQAKFSAQKNHLYNRGMRLALKDIINKKGMSIDLLKRRSEALNSGKFTNEEIRLLKENIDQPSIYPFEKSILDQQLAKRHLESRLRQEMIGSYRGELNNEIITINQISEALKPGELLVEYIRQNDFYYIMTLSHEGEIFIETAGKENNIDKLIDDYLSDLSDIKNSHKSDSSKHLKDLLLAPIEDKILESKIVYISPDASLHKIPFHLVISDQDKDSSFPTTRLVTSGRDLLKINNQITKQGTNNSVVLANPDFNFNPAHNKVSDEKSGHAKWMELSGTQKEGKEITKLLGATYISQKKATKQFIQTIQSPKILHIATHAFYNQEGKNLKTNSGMVFAGANNLPAEDSIMSPEEISVLNLQQTRLSVLSACETGIGAVLDGGSIASIQRAFTIAGSQSVINTLWKVDDYSTRAFMKSFYTNLKGGMSLEDSLSTTREYFQKHPIARWRDPYFWAAFQLYGYWGPIF